MAERRLLSHRRILLVAATALLLVIGFLIVRAASADDPADRFVTRSGRSLEIAGQPFRFVGFNLYDAAASDIYSCSPSTRLDDEGLDDAMAAIHDAGGTVVRFWAYQTYTHGGTDFSGIDRVIAAARAHDLRVLPVLEDGPGDCSTGQSGVPLGSVDDGTWYSQGYKEPLGSAAVSYRAYAATIAHHYRDNPTILGWSLINEAETTARDDAGDSALVDFARDVAGVVHAADPHHLVTLGTQSNGAPGASGADFTAVYGLPGLDFAEAHDWGDYGSDSEAMPGSTSDGKLPTPDECQASNAQIACAFVLARQLGKPLVIGEAGISADDGAGRTTRAQQFHAKIGAAFSAGAAGYLIWQLNDTNTDGYAVLVGEDDPVYAVLDEAATRWATRP